MNTLLRSACMALMAALCAMPALSAYSSPRLRFNIVFVLLDDAGFSDLGS